MIIVPFLTAHIEGFELQDMQSFIGEFLKDGSYLAAMSTMGPAHSAIKDGRVIACAGMTHFTPGRAMGWALISKHATKRDFVGITHATRAFLDRQKVRRIETTVRADFTAGHYWAKKLGFDHEGTMRKFGEDGMDYDIYARVKKHG